MTILNDLASLSSPVLAERVERQQLEGAQGGPPPAAPFDNRPSWDNWTKHSGRSRGRRGSLTGAAPHVARDGDG